MSVTIVGKDHNPLEDLIVCMPLAELGYQRYWQMLLTIPDFGWLIQHRRVITHSGSYVHATPGVLVKEAFSEHAPPWKRLLWLEHDHVFPEDVFRRHATYGEAVVSGLYTLRDIENPMPVVYKWNEARTSVDYYTAPEMVAMGIGGPDDARGVHEVDVVPMGCTSVRRDVLEQWPQDKPMFNSYVSPQGTLVGHDVWFCRMAQDSGWPIHIDTSLRVKHFSLLEMDDSYFLKWWNVIGSKLAAERVEAAQ